MLTGISLLSAHRFKKLPRIYVTLTVGESMIAISGSPASETTTGKPDRLLVATALTSSSPNQPSIPDGCRQALDHKAWAVVAIATCIVIGIVCT